MNQELNFSDAQLEQAMNEIRNEPVDDAVVESAALRVWAKLEAARQSQGDAEYLGTCAKFQALIPDFKAGRLGESQTLLLRDHLHECVACRRVYEGRKPVDAPAQVTVMPQRASRNTFRWGAVAAAVVASAGATIWMTTDHANPAGSHAVVQALNGALFAVTAHGITPLNAGQDLPDGVEIRTAKDSDALVKLKDGSVVEVRERSGFSTEQSASDLTIRLLRGAVIVQAAKRTSGHLYVSTADCRVAVTGTIFGVTAGSKGSRVSVIQGEVHVEQNNQDKVLHPGGQMVTNPELDPETVSEDIAWSREHDRYDSLLKQLNDLKTDLKRIPMPGLRYSSALLPRMPGTLSVYISIPNMAEYLTEARDVFEKKLADSPQLRQWWESNGAKSAAVFERLRGASEYSGDEIAIVAVRGGSAPVFITEVKKDGFDEYVKKNAPGVTVEMRNGVAVVGPPAEAKRVADSLDDPKSTLQSNIVYQHAMDAFRRGAGFLLVAAPQMESGAAATFQYVVAGEKQSSKGMTAEMTIGFQGERTGLAAWLAAPGPMGSLEYLSQDSTLVAAFLVKDASAITDQLHGIFGKSAEGLGPVRDALAKSLGGEFAIGLDGPAIPVPSWRLVAEAYDPSKVENSIEQAVEQYNQNAATNGDAALELSTEQADGKTFHHLAVSNSGPLMVFWWTFDNGYLVVAPARGQVEKALQVRVQQNSIVRSAKFTSMMPENHHANFSGVLFENLGTTLQPLTSLFSGMVPQGGARNNPLAQLGNIKPYLIGAYAGDDKLTFATNGDVLGPAAGALMSGDIHGALPFLPMFQGQKSRKLQEVH